MPIIATNMTAMTAQTCMTSLTDTGVELVMVSIHVIPSICKCTPTFLKLQIINTVYTSPSVFVYNVNHRI